MLVERRLIENSELREWDIPPPRSDFRELVRFALSYDPFAAYAELRPDPESTEGIAPKRHTTLAKLSKQVADQLQTQVSRCRTHQRRTGEWPDSLRELRLCLFFARRSDTDYLEDMHSLLEAIRAKVKSREFD